MTKFLLLADPHGKKPKIKTKQFDAIICPGDFCSDTLRPYITKYIKLRTKIGKKPNFNKICPKPLQKKLYNLSLKKGRKILEYLNSFQKPVFIVPGNWDPAPYFEGIKTKEKNLWDQLKKGLNNIIDIQNKKATYKGITLIGHGSTSSPEPLKQIPKNQFQTQKEYLEYNTRVKYFQQLLKKLSSLIKKSKNPIIFLSHNSPYNTKLDLVNKPKTYAHKKHYGSIIARKLIEKYQPLLCISGHIHEGYGKTKIGKTTCINSGLGPNINILLNINEKTNKITKMKFSSQGFRPKK